MSRLWSRPLLLPGIAGAVSLGIVALGWLEARGHVAAVRRLRSLPRAELSAPREGPAVYEGTLEGPGERATPTARPSAAVWWWVDEKPGKNWKNVCRQSEASDLVLSSGDRSAKVAILEGAPDYALGGMEHDEDWELPVGVDLGDFQHSVQDAYFPGPTAACRRDKARLIERWIAPGARVDVVGCLRGDVLSRCEGPIEGLLAVGTRATKGLDVHVERRASAARTALRIATLIAAIVLTVVLLVAAALRGAALEPLRPRTRS